ncbi:NAD(P)/FAD-dependent oxidoreductase (plasmid) [Agrobacterium radiobacter]|uniref:Glycine/d-amino acid oxidases (Deaminating) n=1 Tax=Agrobacterium tumefaciens str. B6 TaxID=1183423 RepID=A0A822VBI5_AGRTU|nr:FAD-binding oxidoreductase [Agrobacterium tumefaciens]MQB27800.1 FAD-binding oxidoreductase [Agrobacterium tumefaciens]NTA08426.1 FAD-binding oxidoreductase [Agrobacterium tumefaciens]NTB16248.1 FAD-binding oxidoreductase [Agrobacterium tumefaciens]CVI25295.1 Glycine/d-amino acid oxidases (Deaminating) [Agrobacterium tumefaciens str. B6]SPZ49560.1 putative D-amino acid dehydrogenase [Agrobacterium tumefaciens]
MSPSSHQHIVVIGAGIIGIQCALELQTRGFSVSVVDSREPGTATSEGNAGCIAVAEIFPISLPGLIWSVPKMLADPLGPLSIRWGYLPQLSPWLWQFLLAGRRRPSEKITGELAALLGHSWSDHQVVAKRTGTEYLFKHEGFLFAYHTERGYKESAHEWSVRTQHGISYTRLTRNELLELEPELNPGFFAGVHVPGVRHSINPKKLVQELALEFKRNGGAILKANVKDFGFQDGRMSQVFLDNGQTVETKGVVLAAGAWSGTISRKLGYKVPLDTERGYNTTIPSPGISVTRPIFLVERSAVVTPMEMGLRIGGAVELAGLKAPANFSRAKALLSHGKSALPRLNLENGREWMGFRPSMPDSKPIISRSGHHPNVYFAFGHGHLGLTLAATTARLIGDMSLGDLTPPEAVPFSIERFV